MMDEIDEIIDGKTIKELEDELCFQLEMGESIGGEICSRILHAINQKKRMIKA
jgi:hypothetical protein